MAAPDLARFGNFLERARGLRKPAPANQFRKFLAAATPLATAHARRLAARLAPAAQALAPWIVEHDLLEIAGYANVETALTSLMAWALYPPGRPDVGLACQRAWTARVIRAFTPPVAVRPNHQFSTADGIPDLVLAYESEVLIIEAKTKSLEHAAPSGAPQTIAYVNAVRDALNDWSNARRYHVIFLTYRGETAANERAIRSTYAEFALALAKGLAGLGPADALWPAYAMLITHLLRCGGAPGSQLDDALKLVIRWESGPSQVHGARLLASLASIQTFASMLLPREEV